MRVLGTCIVLLRADTAHTPKSLAIRALTIDRNLGRRLQEGMRLAQLGHVYAAMGQSAKARQHSEQALVIARETNNLMTEVLCLLQLERYAEAAELAHEKGLLKQEYEACDQLYTSVRDKKVVKRVGNLRLFLYIYK